VGYAKNLHDGTVEVAAYGEKKALLEELLIHCRQGPRSARVNDMHIEWRETEVVPSEFFVR
jgi:acylphosphatase